MAVVAEHGGEGGRRVWEFVEKVGSTSVIIVRVISVSLVMTVVIIAVTIIMKIDVTLVMV